MIEPPAPPEAQSWAQSAGETSPAATTLFNALFDSATRASPPTGAHTAGIGRLGAPAAPTKRKAQSDNSLDPTAAAVAALATRGTPKATVQAAESQQTSPSNRSFKPTRVATGAISKELSSAASTSGHATERTGNPASGVHQKDGASQAKHTPVRAITAEPASPNPRANAFAPIRGAAVQSTNPAAISRLLNATAPRANTATANTRPVLRPILAQPAQAQTGAKGAHKASAPPRPQDPESEFATQLGRGFAAILRQGSGSLTLRLQPEALGEMTIRMDLQPGKVAAEFEVQTDQARQLLDANLSALRSALEARGLNVDSLTVHLGGGQPPANSETPMQDASAHHRSETGSNHGGAEYPDGGATGQRDAGTDRPVAGGAMLFAPSRSESLSEADAPDQDEGGARLIRLALDAIA